MISTHRRGPSVAAAAAALLVACSSSSTPAPSFAAAAPSALPSTLAATAAATPAPKPTASSLGFPDTMVSVATGRILFAIEGNGQSRPAYIDATGLHLVPMSTLDGSFAHPTWAPDGTIFFDSERAGARHIFHMGTDGSPAVQVTSDAADGQERTSVSPDGSLIAFDDYVNVDAGADLGLHVAKADGSASHPVTPGGPAGTKGGDSWAQISPDGHSIAFERAVDFDAGIAGLWVMHIDGTGLRRLAPDSLGVGYPRWSPDGMQILFTQHYDAKTGALAGPLWVVPADGSSEPKALTDPSDPGWSFEGDWSPDGRQIVFKYYGTGFGGHNELHLVNADGTNATTLWVSPDGYTAETPDWGK